MIIYTNKRLLRSKTGKSVFTSDFLPKYKFAQIAYFRANVYHTAGLSVKVAPSIDDLIDYVPEMPGIVKADDQDALIEFFEKIRFEFYSVGFFVKNGREIVPVMFEPTFRGLSEAQIRFDLTRNKDKKNLLSSRVVAYPNKRAEIKEMKKHSKGLDIPEIMLNLQ